MLVSLPSCDSLQPKQLFSITSTLVQPVTLGWSLCLLHCCCSLKISHKVFGSYLRPNWAPFPIHPWVCPVLIWKKNFKIKLCCPNIQAFLQSMVDWLIRRVSLRENWSLLFQQLTIANGSTTRDESVCLWGGLCGNEVLLFKGSSIPLFGGVSLCHYPHRAQGRVQWLSWIVWDP